MRKTFLLALSVILFLTPVASEIDTAIVASTNNYPDAFVASTASQATGAPIFLTERSMLPPETMETLEKQNLSKIIIVGGPGVVSEAVQTQLEGLADTTVRTWGMSQVGTSVETSEYFWTESENVTIVQYPLDGEEYWNKGYKVLATAAQAAGDEPVLISKQGTLSASVLQEVDRLNATRANVYATSSFNVSEELAKIGVEANIIEKDADEMVNSVEKKENSEHLVAVIGGGFQPVISASSSPESSVVFAGHAEQQTQLIKRLNSGDYESVRVVGNSERVRLLAEDLRSETDVKVVTYTGDASAVSRRIYTNSSAEWSEIQQRKLSNWKQTQKNHQGFQSSVNKSLKRASQVIGPGNDRALQTLRDAQESYRNGDYFEARQQVQKALAVAKMEDYRSMSWAERNKEATHEIKGFKEALNDLRSRKTPEVENERYREKLQKFEAGLTDTPRRK